MVAASMYPSSRIVDKPIKYIYTGILRSLPTPGLSIFKKKKDFLHFLLFSGIYTDIKQYIIYYIYIFHRLVFEL